MFCHNSYFKLVRTADSVFSLYKKKRTAKSTQVVTLMQKQQKEANQLV